MSTKIIKPSFIKIHPILSKRISLNSNILNLFTLPICKKVIAITSTHKSGSCTKFTFHDFQNFSWRLPQNSLCGCVCGCAFVCDKNVVPRFLFKKLCDLNIFFRSTCIDVTQSLLNSEHDRLTGFSVIRKNREKTSKNHFALEMCWFLLEKPFNLILLLLHSMCLHVT